MLSHTAVTPNAVTFVGIIVSLLSAVAFAHGAYWWSLLGAALFYVAGLFDQMDGMLARVKFAESPRGTYLEGFADGLSYLLLFTGITIGMYRHYGRPAIFMGVALLIGTGLALITTTLQRKRATTPDRPNEYLGNFYRVLEKDSGNWIPASSASWAATKKSKLSLFPTVSTVPSVPALKLTELSAA